MSKKILMIILQIVFVFMIIGGLVVYFVPWQELAFKRQSDIEIVVRSEEESQQTFDDSEPLKATTENLNNIEHVYANGWLVIPQEGVGISLPINSGIGGDNMLYAASEQFERSTVRAGGLGNYVLASHITAYEGQLFTNLHRVKVGSTVHVADDENIYVYEVTSSNVETIGSTSHIIAQPLEKTTAEITLYTCSDLEATQRYVVKGKLTSTTKIDKHLNQETRVAFSRWLQSIGK